MAKKKKKTNKNYRITVEDYIKAVKKANREIELEQQPGWQRSSTIHKNKKAYNRRDNKRNFLTEE